MKHAIYAGILLLALAGPAAAQTPAGPEFRVNTYTYHLQLAARPAMEPDGDFVVVWQSYYQDDSHYGVFGQRFAASGAPRGSEFRVNAYTTGPQYLADVAVGKRGDFVVVWTTRYQDGSSEGIDARRFDASGSAIGGDFQVPTFTSDRQYVPQVGRAPDGRFVVSWSSYGVDGDGFGIAAQRFDASGNRAGGEFVVNTYTTGHQNPGDLAVQANGNFVAVWQDDNSRDGSGTAIFGQRFDSAGTRLGSEFQVNSFTTGDQKFPSLSVSLAGGFAVVWTSQFGDGSGTAVFARSFDASGNAVGSDFVVNTYTTGNQYGYYGQVARDGRGNFVVTWTGPGDGSADGTFAQRFDASGTRRGAEFQVNTYTTDLQVRSTVASDEVGNFLVVWSGSADQDGSTFGVFGQRFGGLAPAALAVDSSANGVLEPGETVAVRPSWRNFNGAAQTFSGTLTDITGPAGATYAIIDGAGSYGTVADGAEAPCIDCYAVSVSHPTPRPAVHWDASAVESILPDIQGQQKTWLLHVGDSFSDVPRSNGFYRFVETLLHRGVTSGCSATAYCPGASTTREQLAVFVLVGKEGAGYVPTACGATPVFADVPASSPFCRWIEELARRGVVSGCGGGNYCPTAEVTREQMTVFVLRVLDPALNPPPCVPPNLYLDVPETSPFCRWIEELTARNVVGGCGNQNFCPTATLTREQMGVFITVTFGLTLYGP